MKAVCRTFSSARKYETEASFFLPQMERNNGRTAAKEEMAVGMEENFSPFS